ncbi:MAG: hypothetical protein CSA26_06030 [Desulfobacterales bacterium]|nr:MAG: hypothetical protein CSA26_06030 [Desulfobacterales bacterium]
MKLICPHCGVSGKTKKSLSGCKVRCPQCTGTFLVPVFESGTDAPLLEKPEIEKDFEEKTIHAVTHHSLEETAPALSEGHWDRGKRAVAVSAETTSPDLFPDDQDQEVYKPALVEMTDDDSADITKSDTIRIVEPSKGIISSAINAREEDVKEDGFGHSADRDDENGEKNVISRSKPQFTINSIISEGWRLTKGVKGSLWGGFSVTMVILFFLGSITILLLPEVFSSTGKTITIWVVILIQLVSFMLAMTFTAGLMYMGIKRAAGMHYSWKTVFSGFTRLSQISIAGLLMTVFITAGLLLFILPGIYLMVGYSLTLPLIIDKRLGPWDAMETSRKTIHGQWWRVFAVYLLIKLISLVSFLPFGLGTIWTIPLFFTVSGVIYCFFFRKNCT